MSLRSRVALAGGLVVLVALVIASLVIYPWLDAKLSQQHDAMLVSTVGDAGNTIRQIKDKFHESRIEPPFFQGQPLDVGSTKLQLLLPPVSAGPSPDFVAITDKDLQVAAGTLPPYFHDAEYGGITYRIYTAPFPENQGTLVRAAIPTSAVGAPLNRLMVVLVLITLGGSLAAALVARLAAGRVLRPVHRLTETVEHITATQDLNADIEIRGRDEIARLARAFASMTAALDASITTQRRLVADASHELRTPLTSLNTNLELLDEGLGVRDPQAPLLVAAAREQIRQLMALVEDLTDLERYGHNETHTEDTRLDLLAARVTERAAARAPHLTFTTDLTECLVHGDPDALERAAANLVDNAVKWSPPGGRVAVQVDEQGTLRVTDQGPGIAAGDLPYVFDRFYRSPAARSLPGSGLGLPIVRQIAETHGGTITIHQPAGGGAGLRLTLPPLRGPAEPDDPTPPPSPWPPTSSSQTGATEPRTGT
ncbi:sensor histidine kinase [Streptomyces sp. NPDC005227]|uniref:sensor histidine kinase n=1 Tax=unclassified Streptomyces TaxID=2593676 RepID=UPI0036A5E4B5